jgi:thiol-disulfide isomerase/thioredoxin
MLSADSRFGRGFDSRRLHHLLPFLFVAAAAAFVLRGDQPASPRSVALADVPLLTLEGAPVAPRLVRDNAVVLTLWATWCAACRLELRDLDQLQRDVPGAVVLGVEDDSDPPGAGIAYARAQRLSFPLLQTTPAVQKALGRSLDLPTTLYLSRTGKVVHAVSGAVPLGVMRRYARDAVVAG